MKSSRSRNLKEILPWTPNKGTRLRDDFQEPVTSAEDDRNVHFLCSLFDWLDAWLDVWESKNLTSGTLTKETHGALRQTTRALVQITEYCFTELGLNYVLLGKIQTDSLEDRFGKYRQLAGSQYHISIRQLYEGENKLRLQSTLPTIPCEDERWEQLEKQVDTPRPSCNI